MENKNSGFVTVEELYKYSSDTGLMLSWGIPLTKILKDMEKETDNPILKKVNLMLFDRLIKGEAFEDVLGKFPEIFRPVFRKWVKIGEKFGLLDDVLLKLAGLLKIDYLICSNNSIVSRKKLGEFLIKFSAFLYEEVLKETKKSENKNQEKILFQFLPQSEVFKNLYGGYSSFQNENYLKTELIPALKQLTDEPVIYEWLSHIPDRFSKGSFFGNSLRNYHIYPFYRKIAGPFFWNTLEMAEAGGYLIFMLEILGLYLIDKNNLFPSGEKIEIEEEIFLNEESPLQMAGELLDKIEKSGNKKAMIEIRDDNFEILIDGSITDLSNYLEIKDTWFLQSVISALKIKFDLDAVEKRLSQKTVNNYCINNKNYRVHINIIPPLPLLEGEKVYEAIGREEKENKKSKEIIEIKLERVSNVQ